MNSNLNSDAGRYRTIREAMAKGKFGRSRCYLLLNTGALRAVKAGKRTLIEDSSIDEYLSSLPAYEPKAA